MKPLMIVGIILIAIGVIALAYGGFSFTTSEKVAEVGPLKLEKDKTRSVPMPPVMGGLAFDWGDCAGGRRCPQGLSVRGDGWMVPTRPWMAGTLEKQAFGIRGSKECDI